jgi:hypothetical protein
LQEVEVEEKSIITEKLDAFKNKIKKKKAAIRSKVYFTVYSVHISHSKLGIEGIRRHIVHISHAKLGTEGILFKVYTVYTYLMPSKEQKGFSQRYTVHISHAKLGIERILSKVYCTVYTHLMPT